MHSNLSVPFFLLRELSCLGGVLDTLSELEGPEEILIGVDLIEEGFEAAVPEIGGAAEAFEFDELFEFDFLGRSGAAGGEVLGHLFVSCAHEQKATTPRKLMQQTFCLTLLDVAIHCGVWRMSNRFHTSSEYMRATILS
jgi:hypothetical protein